MIDSLLEKLAERAATLPETPEFQVENSEWLADKRVLRAAMSRDGEHHRLIARVGHAGVRWDCSCGDPECVGLPSAVRSVHRGPLPAPPPESTAAGKSTEGVRLHYLLLPDDDGLRVEVLVGEAPASDLPRLDPARGLGEPRPRFVADADVAVLARLANQGGRLGDDPRVIESLIKTGRARWRDVARPRLEWGGVLDTAVTWRMLADGSQQLEPVLPHTLALVAREPLLARDPAHRLYVVHPEVPSSVWSGLSSAIPMKEIETAWASVSAGDPGLPPPFIPKHMQQVECAMEPRLHLTRREGRTRGRLMFGYDDAEAVPASDRDPVAEPSGDDAILHPRDWAGEASAMGRLRRAGWQQGPVDWTLPGGEATLAKFLLSERDALEAEGWRLETGEGCPRIEFLDPGDLRLKLDGESATLEDPETGANLLGGGAATSCGDYLLLETGLGRVVAIPVQLMRDVQLALGSSRKPGRARFAALPLEIEGGGWTDTGSLRRLGDIRPDIPAMLRADLRGYQRTGFEWLWRLDRAGFGGILADDMGLGKTVQALTVVASFHETEPEAPPVLVVAPVSVLNNWQSEARRFCPGLKVAIHHGPDRRRRRWSRVQVVVTTYALLRQEQDRFEAQTWRAVILDEAQAIKNPRSRTARAARSLSARFRLCLTGTPMENHLGELWSLFAFAEPGLLGSMDEFERVFRGPIEAGDDSRHRALVRRIGPFILRRTREQVLGELPPLIENELRVELGPEQRALYESVRAAAVQDLATADEDSEIARRGRVLQIITRLRQACCAPSLLPDDFPMRDAPSAKLEAVAEMLEELVAEGRAVLVFSQFRGLLDTVSQQMFERRIQTLMLTGDTSDRAAVVRRFQGGEAPVFLISLKAGGAGLNLTRADTVILLDPWWNPAVESQAAARAHRMGQDKPVFVYRVIAADTIEDSMQRLKAGKRQIGDALSQAVAALDLADPEVLNELLDAV